MTPLFRKLNLGTHLAASVLNAPASFEPEVAALVATQPNLLLKKTITSKTGFALAFAITQRQLDIVSTKLARACVGDAVLWVAFPKGTSKKYRCEFNRDTGWDVLSEAGFEPVRIVAIDEDWSALRFRRVQHIKTQRR
jgi:hypothetical protein